MSTFQDPAPRKRATTYGKAARRRVPEYSFSASASTSDAQISDQQSSQKAQTRASPVPSAVPRNPTRRSPGKEMNFPKSPDVADVFDIRLSDEDAPIRSPKPRKHITKRVSRRPASEATLPKSSVTTNLVNGHARSHEPPAKIPKSQKPTSKPAAKSVKKAARAPSPNSTTTFDVFDFPMSDNEPSSVTPKPKKHTLDSSSVLTGTLNIDADMEQRKRVKTSPVNESALKRIPMHTKNRSSNTTNSGLQKHNTAFNKEVTVNVGLRSKVKPQESILKSKQALTPPTKTSFRLGYQVSAPNTPSPRMNDIDMVDVGPHVEYLSPRSTQMWEGLLEPDSEVTLGNSNGNPGRNRPSKAGPESSKSIEFTLASHHDLPSLPRRRLIDRLAEQVNDENTDDESESEFVNSAVDVKIENEVSTSGRIYRDQSPAPEAPLPISSSSQSQNSHTSGPKFTYGQARTILAEQDPMKELTMELPTSESGRNRNRRGSIPVLQPLSTFHEEDEDEDCPAAVRSVHELRQAGANNRFLDEIEDFMERIGNPASTQLSMRRSGLLDLARKMKDKTFSRQFRDNGVESRLFAHLGQETDIVSGFIMVSLLTIVLVEGNVPHIVLHLRRQGVTRLLIRLIENESSIIAISKERKINMSKIVQSLLAEHHDSLIQMPIWEELKPRHLSPRTMALKCLEKMVRQTRDAGDAGDIFSKELTTNLFAILNVASDESSWDLPEGKRAIDFALTLSALESHSITARTAHDESLWICEYLPIIADALQIAMSRPSDSFGDLQFLILRLTLNVTNGNSKASDVFAKPNLMAIMGHVIIAKFKQISGFIAEDVLEVTMVHLIVVLGVMINFADGSSASRQSLQSLEGKSNDPLDRLTQIWVDNQEMMLEADSVQESQKNVAFGYLSVLLGYSALLPAICERIQKRHPKKTLKPLISSINEFIGYHKTVDQLVAQEDGHDPQSSLTERLENLVTTLSASKEATRVLK